MTAPKKIHAVVKLPGKPATVELVDELDLKRIVGGYLELVRLPVSVEQEEGVRELTLDLWIDEEGKLKRLPMNFVVGAEPIVGPAVFTSHDRHGDLFGLDDLATRVVLALLE